jgi:hypothetical protein
MGVIKDLVYNRIQILQACLLGDIESLKSVKRRTYSYQIDTNTDGNYPNSLRIGVSRFKVQPVRTNGVGRH